MMKYIFSVVILLSLFSCDKAENGCGNCTINYPQTGNYGDNYLYGNDTIYSLGTGNSLSAIVPEGGSLIIEMELISGGAWMYDISSKTGWDISSFTNNTQSFTATSGLTADLSIIKSNRPENGIILIKYYENGSSITKKKVLIWQ